MNIFAFVTVVALVGSCTAARLNHVQSTDLVTRNGGHLNAVTESDANCDVSRETLTSQGGGKSVVVNDFTRMLMLVSFSAEDGVCHVRLMTQEERRRRCSGEYVNAMNDPSDEEEIEYEVTAELDVTSLPNSITKGNNCLRALLLSPVATDSDGPSRRRRQAATTAAPGGCSTVILVYRRCVLLYCDQPATGGGTTAEPLCTYYCRYYLIPVQVCPNTTPASSG